LDESTNEISESFDTKLGNDTEVSGRKFESFESKDSENDSSADRILKVSSGNFESSESKVLKVDGRTKPRSQKQIDTFKKNFSKSKSMELKIQELDLRMRHLQSLVLRLM
jgi:hypothetical protein